MRSSSQGCRASAARPISSTPHGNAPHLLIQPQPKERAAVLRMASARVRRRDLVRQPHRRHLTDALHNGRRLLVGDPQALPALDPRRHLRPRPRQLQHPSPPCPRPQPRALGRGDRLLLDQSVTRSWSSRLRRRQEDRRHQTPRRRGHGGLLVAVLVTAATVQDRAAVPRLLGRARYRCPGARPSVGRAGLHRQRRAGREQDPAVHDPDRRRDQSQGRLYHPASSLVVERTFAWMHRCRRLTRQYE
jgi:hypothetical protein